MRPFIVNSNHDIQNIENPNIKSTTSTHFTDRASRSTERMKRGRNENGVDGEEDEDSEEGTYHQQQQDHKEDYLPSASISSSSNSSSDVQEEEEEEEEECSSSFPFPPVTRSEKKEWREELCQLLKDNEGPMTVKDFINHYGWSPASQSGRAYRVEPSLCEHIIVVQGLVYALPTDEEWYKLSKAMRKSDKIQSIEGLDASGNAKTFKFLSSDDYMAEYEQVYDAAKGLFKVTTTFDDGEIRRQHLSCWVTNRNGKWFLDEKPSSVGRRERKRAHKELNETSSPSSDKQHQEKGEEKKKKKKESPSSRSSNSGSSQPTKPPTSPQQQSSSEMTMCPSNVLSTISSTSSQEEPLSPEEEEEALERKIKAQNLPLWLTAPIRFV